MPQAAETSDQARDAGLTARWFAARRAGLTPRQIVLDMLPIGERALGEARVHLRAMGAANG